MAEKPDCSLCRKIKAINGKSPECEKCLGTLMPENAIPFALFWSLRHQLVMGPAGPIGLRIDIARAEVSRVVRGDSEQDYCLALIMAGCDAYLEKLRSLKAS